MDAHFMLYRVVLSIGQYWTMSLVLLESFSKIDSNYDNGKTNKTFHSSHFIHFFAVFLFSLNVFCPKREILLWWHTSQLICLMKVSLIILLSKVLQFWLTNISRKKHSTGYEFYIFWFLTRYFYFFGLGSKPFGLIIFLI